jgi:4-amino-4-deoxy-L-arabinose transferase-like glycosyltransferase
VEVSTHKDRAHGLATAGPQESRPTTDPAKRLSAAVRWVGDHPAIIVLCWAMAAGIWAVAGSQRVFPYLSDDHDEGIYLLQAHALADGHVFPTAPRHPDSFIPWLSVLSGDKYVVKYSPVHAFILAIGVRTLGSARWSLGLIAAGVVTVTYLLAKEVLGDRKQAALASGFLGLSPLFLIQSATFLPYCSSLLLLETFAFTLLRGLRSNGPILLAGSGLGFGAALFARPYDALLFAMPLGLYFLISQRHRRAQLLRNAGWFALGALTPLMAMLAFNRAATGSPFRPPFNLLEPQDTLGFGPRKLLPGQPAVEFTPARGSEGVGRHFLLTSFWGFGGLVLMGFFFAGLARRRRNEAESWLVLIAVTFSLGYLFFWGTYGTGLHGSLTAFLGPFYFLPVLVPVTLLAAKGFHNLWQSDWVLAVSGFAGMVVVSGYLLVQALEINLRLTEEDRRLYTPVAAANLDRALVLLPPMWGQHLLHPFNWLQNAPEYDGERVYALDRGEPANLALLDDYPGREVYRLRVHGNYRANPQDPDLTTSLEPLTVTEKASLDLRLTVPNSAPDARISVSVGVNGTKETFIPDTSSTGSETYQASISIGPDSVEWHGPLAARSAESVDRDGSIVVSISAESPEGGPARMLYQRQFAHVLHGPNLRLLLPGIVSVNELGRDPVAITS